MKINRLSTRVLAVFAAVLLMMTLSIPTFAATSYFFPGTVDGISGGDFFVPEGRYNVIFTHGFGEESISISAAIPVDVKYKSNTEGLVAEFPVEMVFGEYSPVYSASLLYVSDLTFLVIKLDGIDILYEEVSVTFVPVSGTAQLSDYISADILPNVFNEIISLLPLALGALVSFIAIRKGISYLQSFLHSS